MIEKNFIELILKRLGQSQTVREVFGTDETKEWPPHLLPIFIKNRVFKKIQPAQSVICTGCEQDCPMPVTVLPKENNRPARAFITCDKQDDIGRVPVDLKRLEQWEINSALIAKKISSLMGFKRTPQEEKQGKEWNLGILKGKKQKGQLILDVENETHLKLVGHEIPLEEILSLKDGDFLIDKDELLRLVDNPTLEAKTGYKPSSIKRESRKIATQERYKAWKKAYRELKRKKPHMSDVWYSNQISKMNIADGREAETIRKHMKK